MNEKIPIENVDHHSNKKRYDSFDGNCDQSDLADSIEKELKTNKIHHLLKSFSSMETDFWLIFLFSFNSLILFD